MTNRVTGSCSCCGTKSCGTQVQHPSIFTEHHNKAPYNDSWDVILCGQVGVWMRGYWHFLPVKTQQHPLDTVQTCTCPRSARHDDTAHSHPTHQAHVVILHTSTHAHTHPPRITYQYITLACLNR